MMDRNKAAELPKLQVGFIDFVCTFVYKVSTPGSQAEEGTSGVALPPSTALAPVLLIPVLTVGTVSSPGEATTTSSGPQSVLQKHYVLSHQAFSLSMSCHLP